MFLYVICLFVLLLIPVIRTALYLSRLQTIASHNYHAFCLFIVGCCSDWFLDDVKPAQKQGHTFRLMLSHCGSLKVCYLTYTGKGYYNRALKQLIEAWNKRQI